MPRTLPLPSLRFATVAAALVVLALVGAGALAPSAAAFTNMDSVWVEDDSPNVATNHTWSPTFDQEANGTVGAVELDYSGTGTNLSAIEGQLDLWVDIDNESLDAASLETSQDDQVLTIDFSNNVSVDGGEVLTLATFNDNVVNPPEGSYTVTITAIDESDAVVDSGNATLTVGDPTGTVQGQVTDQDTDDAVAGASVDLLDDEGFVVASTTTGEDGTYTLDAVPDTYDLLVQADGYDTVQETDVVIETGNTTSQNVALPPADGGDDGPDGPSGFENVSISNESLTYAHNGSTIQGLSVRNYTTNLLGVYTTNASYNQDISDVVDGDTELELSFTAYNFSADALIGTAENVTFETEPAGENATNVTITGTPGSAQYIMNEGGSSPSLQNWPEGENDTATVGYDQMFDVALIDLEQTFGGGGDLPPLEGMIIGTDAQAFSIPNYDDQADELSLEVAGPHNTTDGTENDGFFEAYLPKALLDEWGVSDPADLTAAYQGEDRDDLNVTESDRGDGWDLELDVHYSTGEVAISADSTDESDDSDDDSGSGGGGFIAPPSDGGGSAEPDLSIVSLDELDGEYAPGEEFSVDVTVENAGDAEGSTTLTLSANGEALASTDVTVGASGSATATLTGSVDEPGLYALSVNGRDAGTVDVVSDDGDDDAEADDGAEADDADDGPEQPDDGDGADDETPGFGALAALLALATALALRVRERQLD